MLRAKFFLLAPYHAEASHVGATEVSTPLRDDVDHSVCGMLGANHSRLGAHYTVRWRFTAAPVGTLLAGVIDHPFRGVLGAENSASAFFVAE